MTENQDLQGKACPLCSNASLYQHCEKAPCGWSKCRTCKATLNIPKKVAFDAALTRRTWA